MGLLGNIKAALFPPDAGPGSPPAWIGRLQEAKYAAGGFEFPFLYLDLSSFFEVKTAIFGNVDGDGVYVQHNGTGANRFPMLMVFSGGDNDENAKTALSALTYRGDATLTHPVFGPITVVPTGEIQQINAFVTAAGQTSIVVECIETTGLLLGEEEPFGSVLDSYLEGAAKSFDDVVNAIDKAEEISLGQKILGAIGKVKEATDKLSNGVAVTQAAMDDTFDSINSSIDILVKDPLMLARQVQQLIMTPAREIGLIKSKLKAYRNLAADIFSPDKKRSTNTYDNTNRNDFAVDSLVSGAVTAALTQIGVNSTVSGSQLTQAGVSSTVSGSQSATADDETINELGDLFGTVSRAELLYNAEQVSESTDEYIAWIDGQATELSITNNAGDWQDLADASSLSVSKIITTALDAKTEVRVTTEYERSSQAWCYEFYGSIKNRALWYFQQTNDLGGDEILLIKRGRELVYFV